MMGESLVAFYKDKVKKEWKIAFYAAFISCLLIHIYKFANTLPNHDSFFNVYIDQDMTISGRWFLQYACGISSYFDLPWFNGLLCAVWLGITAAAVTELFEIRNSVVIVLSAVVLTATPSTTETFFFGFTADGYLLGLMLSAVAACLSCKSRTWRGYALAGVCLCLSCGIYQAYVSFAVVLCICYLVLRLLNREMMVRDSWKWIGKHMLIYGGALAAYYGIWKAVLLLTGQTATDYQGISEVGRVGVSTLVSGAVKSVKNVMFYFLEWNILEHPITLYAALNIVFIIAFGGVILAAVMKSGTNKDLPRLGMVIFCLVASIPMISMWNFLSESMMYRPMMLHSIVVFYIFALILFDQYVDAKISTLFGLFMAVVLFNFAVMANISYFYLDKCEEVTEDKTVTKIAFVGTRTNDVVISNEAPGNCVHMLTELIEADLLYDNEHLYVYFREVHGVDYAKTSFHEIAVMEKDSQVQQMGVWPAEDSVAVIDDVLVIKISQLAE